MSMPVGGLCGVTDLADIAMGVDVELADQVATEARNVLREQRDVAVVEHGLVAATVGMERLIGVHLNCALSRAAFLYIRIV